VRELSRRGGRYGLATMCVGVGQGVAMAFERVPQTAPRAIVSPSIEAKRGATAKH
jgi:hypothetical protein